MLMVHASIFLSLPDCSPSWMAGQLCLRREVVVGRRREERFLALAGAPQL